MGGRAVSVEKVHTHVSFGYSDAPDVFVLDFEALPGAIMEPVTLPSGYQPQANPARVGGFFDYVLSKEFEGPGPHPYLVRGAEYTRKWLMDPDFQPVTTVAELRQAARAGHLQRQGKDRTPYWSEADTFVQLYTPVEP